MENIFILSYLKRTVNIGIYGGKDRRRCFFGHVNMKSTQDSKVNMNSEIAIHLIVCTPYNRWQYTRFALLFTIILNRSSGTSVTSHKIR